MHHALHHSTCVSCIDILDRSVCARHTFEYTMYVFVLVGLWTHQFMTCDAPGPMLDRSSSSACHSSTSFCSRLQKKAASRCISSSCSIHAPPTFCTFSYFPPHTWAVLFLSFCSDLTQEKDGWELHLSVQIQKKKGIYIRPADRC